jgi:hypothetical protein
MWKRRTELLEDEMSSAFRNTIPRMKMLTLAVGVVALWSGSLASEQAQAVSGQPAPGVKQSVPDLDAQVAYQRAFEATLWAMPAVAIYRLRAGLLEQPGMADNVIDAFPGRCTCSTS